MQLSRTKLGKLFRRLRILLLTLLTGLAITALLASWHGKHTRQQAEARLEQNAEITALQIESRLAAQIEALRGLQSAFMASPDMDRHTFRDIIENQNLLARLPGFVVIAFSRQIPRDKIDRLVAKNRESFDPAYRDYKITPLTGQELLQPVDFLYPVNASTRTYLGLDLLSREGTVQAIGRARDEGRGIASPLARSGAETSTSFALHYPVYTAGQNPQNLAERKARYLGAISALYRVEHMLDQAQLNRFDTLRLFDTDQTMNGTPARSEILIHETKNPDGAQQGQTVCNNRIINLPGRQWRLEICAAPSRFIPAGQHGNWPVWAAGIGLSLLYAFFMASRSPIGRIYGNTNLGTPSELRREEERRHKLETLANETPDIFVVRDAQGGIEYANPAARKEFMLDAAEHGMQPLLTTAELAELAEPLVVPCQHLAPSGETRHFEATIVPIRSPFGCNTGSALLARDISHHVEQAAMLDLARTRLSEMLELSGDWLWEQDTEARFTYLSGGPFKLHDINPVHQITRSRWEMGLGDLNEKQWELHRKTIEDREPYSDLVVTLKANGEPLVIQLSGKPIQDKDGVFAGYRGVGRDISAIRHAQDALHAEKLKLMAMLESLSDGVITTDLSGRVEYMNPVALSLTGHEIEEASGQGVESVFQVIDNETRLPLPSLSRQALQGGARLPPHRNAILLNRFGLTFCIQEAVTSIRNEKGEILGSVIVFRDLSDWLALSAKMEKTAQRPPSGSQPTE
ncbi:PAS domain S-box protein [Formivibrio citricus]|nr:CHASE domain-containing protein [Formivibrio citricus]